MRRALSVGKQNSFRSGYNLLVDHEQAVNIDLSKRKEFPEPRMENKYCKIEWIILNYNYCGSIL